MQATPEIVRVTMQLQRGMGNQQERRVMIAFTELAPNSLGTLWLS
jgi:hypothetical protein